MSVDPDQATTNGQVLAAREVEIALGEFDIDGADLTLPEGEITALVGPNGSGKTTMIRMLSRLLEPDDGAVYLDGKAIQERSTREVARRLAILPQSRTPPEGVTVRELASYGRHPHRGLLTPENDEDRDAIDWALSATRMQDLADREVDSLSGGERQRAWIAMALAQDTDILLLDEPTNHLDIRYQVETLSLVRSLNRKHDLTVAWVLHDLNQAAAYSDRVAVMDDGAIVADGPPEDALDADTLEDVFEVPVVVTEHPTAGTPFIVPLDPVEADGVRSESEILER